jgi:asparagine synthase (glutamine-hydrolysing)
VLFRSILATGLLARAVDSEGLRSFLAYGSVQDPYTLVKGVGSVLPGHTLEWTNGSARADRYWRLPPPDAIRPGDEASLYQTIADKLTDAIGGQLISDVPLGAFLSGGIDSTAIVAVMEKVSANHAKTFSLVFGESEYDERLYARRAAQFVGTDHTEVELRGEAVRHGLPQAISAYDQPSVDGLNTYFVSKAAKDCRLTVALSGVGGDELFGGYGGYYKSLLAERWGPPLRTIAPLIPTALRRRVQKWGIPENVRKAVAVMGTKRHPYFVSRRLFDDRQIDALLAGDIPRGTSWEPDRYDLMEREASGYDPINRASAYELQTYMLSTLLRDTDQMSMAHALEVRVPLIDHLLVEHVFALPGYLKVSKRQPKPLLTKSLGAAIPQECVFRPKRGFVLPFERWLREGLQEEMCETLLVKCEADSWPLERNALADVWSRFQKGTLSWSRVWSLFVLKKWMSRHLGK